MKRLLGIFTLLFAALSVWAQTSQSNYYVCAYVWPSCHDDALARKWIWPEGEGEWEVIRKGNPRFEGHYQPRIPLLGYGHDDDPQVVEQWIQMALGHGVNTFVYDWYWFRDPDGYSGPFLEDALDKGFLGAPSNGKMNFYLMYANHDVKYSYWNYHKWGADADSLLFNPRIGMADWKKVVHRVITKYFHLPNYVKIDGCPVFAIFNTGIFEQGFSSPEEAVAAMDYFREEVKKAGFPGLHVQLTPGGGSDPSSRPGGGWAAGIDRYKINSIAFYNMGGFNPDYEIQNQNAVSIRNRVDTLYDIPLFPTVSIGWDDTPRFPRKGEKSVTHINYNPETFEKYLRISKDYADAHRTTQPPFVMINAWNEWVEGSYLLPDEKWGYGYLDAVKHVFAEPDSTNVLPPWQEGYFDIHHISTGKGECQFLVFPDGTTMVIDCGDMTGQGRGWAHSKALPGNALTPARWAARYMDTFSPKPGELDYVVVSHFHDDHMGHISASREGHDGYRLSGITELAEYERFGTLVDRGYPAYDYPSVERVEKQCTMMKDYKKFVSLQVSQGMKAERFKVGTHKQFRTHSGKWDLDVWNVASDLKVTDGGRKTKDMYSPGDDPMRFDENMFSSVMLFRYGDFKYYTGGDLPGGNLQALKFERDFESQVAPVVGQCDVVKADHHGYRDSSNPYFLRELAPDVVIVDAAEASHPRQETVGRIMHDSRLLFTTSEAGRAKMGEDAWSKVQGTGHIVVRVFPGGDSYKVYVLDALSPDYRIIQESAMMYPGRNIVLDGGSKGKVTAAIQSAVDKVSAAGGGRVTLRSGTFLSGPIQLKDGVELHIADGATLLASPNLSDYRDPAMKHVDREALPRHRSAAFIWADEARNISITGGGTIDGNGVYHIKKKTDPAWTGWEYERIAPAEKTLPRVVFLTGCTNVKVQDVTMTGQPAGWSYWIHDCDSVTFRDCKIFADVRYPNNDGIHINCSRDVDISGCEIETGDDCIVLRANSRSLKENKTCERVYVTDCTLRSWSSAVRIGWDNDGVIRDCHLSNLRIWDSSNGIGCYIPLFKYISASNDYGREATLVEDITVSDVVMDQVYGNPVYFKVPENDPDVKVEGFRNIMFRNVSARALCKPYIRNTDKDNIGFENCTFLQCSPAQFPRDAKRHGYVLAAKPEYDVWEDADTLALRRGIYNPYPAPVGLVDTPAPAGYSPVYVSHYGRHGSRYHIAKKFVHEPLDSLLAARERGSITPLGEEMLSNLQSIASSSDGLWDELSARGAKEHYGIAERMVQRFPDAFGGKRKISAFSSTSRRCIMSMASAISAIKALEPGLEADMNTGQRYMPVIVGEEGLKDAQKLYNHKLDSLFKASFSWGQILSRLYTDASESRASSIAYNIYHAWAEAPCISDTLDFDMTKWLSDDEFWALVRRMDMNMSFKCLRTDVFGDARVQSQRLLLNDIIGRADSALASGRDAATLRYGHDTVLLPLLGYMGVEGYEQTFSLDNYADYSWSSSVMIPMGANVQIVFYKGPGPVLVKILFNERETRIAGLEPVTGPYYNWETLKAFWK